MLVIAEFQFFQCMLLTKLQVNMKFILLTKLIRLFGKNNVAIFDFLFKICYTLYSCLLTFFVPELVHIMEEAYA